TMAGSCLAPPALAYSGPTVTWPVKLAPSATRSLAEMRSPLRRARAVSSILSLAVTLPSMRPSTVTLPASIVALQEAPSATWSSPQTAGPDWVGGTTPMVSVFLREVVGRWPPSLAAWSSFISLIRFLKAWRADWSWSSGTDGGVGVGGASMGGSLPAGNVQ